MKKIIFIVVSSFFVSIAQAEPKKLFISVPEEWKIELGPVKMLLEESYAEIGYKVEYVELPLVRCFCDNGHGQLDGEIVRGVATKENNFLPVKPSYLALDVYAYYKKSRYNKEPDANLVRSSDLAFLNGSTVLEKYFVNSKKIVLVKSEKQLFDMLINNRVDFVLPLRKFNMEKLNIGRLFLFKVKFYHVLSMKNNELVKNIEPVLQKKLLTPKYRMLLLELQEKIQPSAKKKWVLGY